MKSHLYYLYWPKNFFQKRLLEKMRKKISAAYGDLFSTINSKNISKFLQINKNYENRKN